MRHKPVVGAAGFPLRTWYIIHQNCDCASDTYARTSSPWHGIGIRCIYCHRVIGFMSYSVEGTVRARSQQEAMSLYRNGKARKIKVKW